MPDLGVKTYSKQSSNHKLLILVVDGVRELLLSGGERGIQTLSYSHYLL